jgi:hypothetical protein
MHFAWTKFAWIWDYPYYSTSKISLSFNGQYWHFRSFLPPFYLYRYFCTRKFREHVEEFIKRSPFKQQILYFSVNPCMFREVVRVLYSFKFCGREWINSLYCQWDLPAPGGESRTKLIIGQPDVYDLMIKNNISHHFMKNLLSNSFHVYNVQKQRYTLWIFKNHRLSVTASPKYWNIRVSLCYTLREIQTKGIRTYSIGCYV